MTSAPVLLEFTVALPESGVIEGEEEEFAVVVKFVVLFKLPVVLLVEVMLFVLLMLPFLLLLLLFC